MLEEDRLRQDEYEKQYYGFSSTELYVDFKEQTSKAVKMALTEVEAALHEAVGYDKDVSSQKIVDLQKVYMESAKKPLRKFKNEARKIFAIPKNVVLDEDQIKVDPFSDEDIIKLKREVVELEKQLLREHVFLAKCKQLKELIDTKCEPAYEKAESIIKSFKNVPKNMEVAEKEKKVMDLQEQLVQYYFSHESNETENLHLLEAERDFSAL